MIASRQEWMCHFGRTCSPSTMMAVRFFLARALIDFLKSHKLLSQVLEMFVLGVASIFSHYILICVYPLALAAIKSSQFYWYSVRSILPSPLLCPLAENSVSSKPQPRGIPRFAEGHECGFLYANQFVTSWQLIFSFHISIFNSHPCQGVDGKSLYISMWLACAGWKCFSFCTIFLVQCVF